MRVAKYGPIFFDPVATTHSVDPDNEEPALILSKHRMHRSQNSGPQTLFSMYHGFETKPVATDGLLLVKKSYSFLFLALTCYTISENSLVSSWC